MSPCRRCGAPLDPARHLIAVEHAAEMPAGEETRRQVTRSWRHLPCPVCGEAEPLRAAIPRAPRRRQALAALVALAAAGLAYLLLNR